MARGDQEGHYISGGGLESPVEGQDTSGVPSFKMEYGPLKEPGSNGLPIVTGAKKGAKSSGIHTDFYQRGGKDRG